MAEMARLAYFKFEGSIDLDDISAALTEEADPQPIKKILEKIRNRIKITTQKKYQKNECDM